MKNLIKFAALGAALAVSSLSAHATLISGSLGFSGTDTFNGTTSTTFNGGPYTVTSVSGTFQSGLNGSFLNDTVTLPSSVTWASAAGVQLFRTPSAGSPDATFTISTITFDQIVAGFQIVTGTGIFAETGYDPTVGTFNLSSSISGQSTEFEFTSTAAPTPEPSSLMLLGTGLTGAAGMFFRRRRSIA